MTLVAFSSLTLNHQHQFSLFEVVTVTSMLKTALAILLTKIDFIIVEHFQNIQNRNERIVKFWCSSSALVLGLFLLCFVLFSVHQHHYHRCYINDCSDIDDFMMMTDLRCWWRNHCACDFFIVLVIFNKLYGHQHL